MLQAGSHYSHITVKVTAFDQTFVLRLIKNRLGLRLNEMSTGRSAADRVCAAIWWLLGQRLAIACSSVVVIALGLGLEGRGSRLVNNKGCCSQHWHV